MLEWAYQLVWWSMRLRTAAAAAVAVVGGVWRIYCVFGRHCVKRRAK